MGSSWIEYCLQQNSNFVLLKDYSALEPLEELRVKDVHAHIYVTERERLYRRRQKKVDIFNGVSGDEVLILLSVGGDFVFFLFFPILTRHICMYHFIYFLMPPWTHTHSHWTILFPTIINFQQITALQIYMWSELLCCFYYKTHRSSKYGSGLRPWKNELSNYVRTWSSTLFNPVFVLK